MLKLFFSTVFFCLFFLSGQAAFAQTARANYTAENANEVVVVFQMEGGVSVRSTFTYTGERNGKGLWVERFTFDGKQITNRYIEDSHDEWSIYLVGAERSTRNDSAQIDFYERTVKEKTSDGSYSGRIVSFKTK